MFGLPVCHVHFPFMFHLILPTTLADKHHHYSHFTDGKMEAQRAENLLQVAHGNVAPESELLEPVKGV